MVEDTLLVALAGLGVTFGAVELARDNGVLPTPMPNAPPPPPLPVPPGMTLPAAGGAPPPPPPQLKGGVQTPTSLGGLLTDAIGAGLSAQDFNKVAHPTISNMSAAFASIGAGVILAVGITSPYAAPIAIAVLALFNLAAQVEENVRNQASLSWLSKMAAQYKYDNYGRWLNPRAVFEFYIAGVTANPTDQSGGWAGVPMGNQGGFSTTLPQQVDPSHQSRSGNGVFVDDDSDAAEWQAYLGADAPTTFPTADGRTYTTRTVIKAATLWALSQPQELQGQAMALVHQLCDQIAECYPWVTGINGLSGREVSGALYWLPKARLTANQVQQVQQQQQQTRQQTAPETGFNTSGLNGGSKQSAAALATGEETGGQSQTSSKISR